MKPNRPQPYTREEMARFSQVAKPAARPSFIARALTFVRNLGKRG